MPRPRRYVPRDSSHRRLWIYLAILAFLVVDVLLISWALGARSATAPTTTPGPIPAFTPEVSATPTPTPSAATVAIPPTRILSALDGTTAWRATTGECPSALVTPELTTDGGQSWQMTDATDDVQITALQGLTVASETQIEIVGLAAEDCSPQFARSFVAGEEYSTNADLLEDQWYVDPADRSVVHTPEGEVDAPCETVVDIAFRTEDDASAAIVCADNRVFATLDSGTTWTVPITGVGIVHLAATAVGYVIATVGLSECSGVQLTAYSVDLTTATPAGCLVTKWPAEAVRSNIAISEAADGTIWVWVHDTVVRSMDKGTSWR